MNSYTLPAAIQKAAAEWFVILTSETATDAERTAWLQWLEQHPSHEQAWQQIEAVTRKFSMAELSPNLGMQLLDRPASLSRRRAVKQLVMLMAVGGTGFAGYRQIPLWNADYRTALGERREFILADGSRLTLNSNSSVDIVFDNNLRRIILQRGEILIDTAQEKNRTYRPLVAETAHGKVMALGTRFSVYQMADKTRVNLYQGQVEIRTAGGQQFRLGAQHTIGFDTQTFIEPASLSTLTSYWVTGMLVVDNMPLLEFIHEVSRYRRGHLAADTRLADLRISGAFPLADTDAILRSLTLTLPVEIQSMTQYWVTLKPKMRN